MIAAKLASFGAEVIKVKPLHVYHGNVAQASLSRCRSRPIRLHSSRSCRPGGTKAKLGVAEGDVVPGPILGIGNSNSRYRFSVGARTFVERWKRKVRRTIAR